MVYVTPTRIEAPNWLSDGRSLIYNSGGRIYRIPAAGGEPEAIDTGFATRCNNDHGISPDGTLLAISDQSQGNAAVPHLHAADHRRHAAAHHADGPLLLARLVTRRPHPGFLRRARRRVRYLHHSRRGRRGDPPDDRQGPGRRPGVFARRPLHLLQLGANRHDADLAMKPDGSEQEPVTADEFNNWFPHLSPDGRSLVFLSYDKDVTGHPPNKDVSLRKLTLATKKIDVLGRFFGGQGTINVPCWSPDGRKIAFVTYQMIPDPSGSAGISRPCRNVTECLWLWRTGPRCSMATMPPRTHSPR